MLDLLFLASLLLSPFVPAAWGITPRPRTADPVAAGRHRRLAPLKATAAAVAAARAATAGTRFGGQPLQLPCKGCGTRAVPPVDYVDSPPIPLERAALVPVRPFGYVITAMCTACDSPLVSRVLDGGYAAHARTLGVIDGELAEAELARTLAIL